MLDQIVLATCKNRKTGIQLQVSGLNPGIQTISTDRIVTNRAEAWVCGCRYTLFMGE